MILVYVPKFYITIVSSFSWVLQSSQGRSKTMVTQKFWGLKKVHHGLCENEELSRFSIIMFEEYSSETQGRSVGSGITEAKVFKNGRTSPCDATLNEPVPRLIRILVCDWAQKIILCPIRGQQNFRRRFSWPNWASEDAFGQNASEIIL